MVNIGNRLRELRLKRNLSQEEVARHIGITRSAYSHYEINNRQPVYETLIKLADFFNVSIDYILFGNNSSPLRRAWDTPDAQEMLQLFQNMSPEQRKKSIRLLNEVLQNQSEDIQA
jgi:transcriptional regulator with XRE-family HTH domain